MQFCVILLYHGGIFMRPRAPISLLRARLILPLIQTLIVLRIEARKWLINGIVGRLVLPYMRRRYAADAMAADRVTYDRLKANRFLPDRVFVQISRRCNLTCSMCGWQIWKRNKGFMSVDLFKRVIAEMTANGIRNLEFTSAQGEPLLSPHAGECVRLAIDAGLNVHLNTNCTTLGDRNIRMLAQAAKSGRFTVQASFSGYDKESHESVYVGSRFEDTSKKLQALYQKFDSEGVSDALAINGIIMDAATKPKHFDYLRTLGIDTKRVRLSYPDNFAGIVPVGSKDQQTGIYSFKLGLPYRPLHLCHLLTSRLVVYDDGQVSACPGRDSENVMNIGDIKTEGFLEMRNGPKYKNMVDAFMARKIDDMPLCAKCDIPYVLLG